MRKNVNETSPKKSIRMSEHFWQKIFARQRELDFHFVIAKNWIRWFSDSLRLWFTGSLTHWIVEPLNPLVHCFLDSVIRWFIVSSIQFFIGSVIHWVIESLTKNWRFIGSFWIFESLKLIHCILDSVVNWFVGSLIHWLLLNSSTIDPLSRWCTIRSFLGAPHNFNRSWFLHRKNFPIGYWFLIYPFHVFRNFRPGRENNLF